MTKAEKEKLKEECEKGLHCLPYDYLVKSIEKEEKTKLRTLQTRIRKMTRKAMIELTHENEMLKAENEALKAKVKHLEELKDINSDIPEDNEVVEAEEPHKLSFEEFVAKYPDGIDPDTFDFDTLSDECKAKLQAECDEGQLAMSDPDDIAADLTAEKRGTLSNALKEEREAYCKAHGIDSKAKCIAVKISER